MIGWLTVFTYVDSNAYYDYDARENWKVLLRKPKYINSFHSDTHNMTIELSVLTYHRREEAEHEENIKIKQNWKCIINLFFFLLFYIILFLFRFLDDERRVKKCIYHLSCHNTISNANFIIFKRSSEIDILICRHNLFTSFSFHRFWCWHIEFC